MRTDRKQAQGLQALARLQGLRVAERALMLDKAQRAREAAQHRQEDAARDLQQQEGELATLLAADHFDPAAFARQGDMVIAQAAAADVASAAARSATTVEEQREGDWQASRYQRDWLGQRHRDATRHLRRKADEAATMHSAALIMIRNRGAQA